MRDFERRPHRFVRGLGPWLWDAQGRRVFDAVSSIWTTIHGHCHPRIVEAIATQAAHLDHATLLGASNPVAERLAERLCALAGMEYAFFASDGASAIEAALKMALQYWQNAGEPQRTRFVRLDDAYHGDTVGAMSVSDIALFKSRFGSVTFEARGFESGAALGDDVAAVIVEPLVQAAAGMRLVPSGDLRRTARDADAGHLRRGRHRLRADGNDVCLRTDAAASRYRLRRQRLERRDAGAFGDARSPGNLRGVYRRARRVRPLLSRSFLRGQSDRVRGGARLARSLRRGADVGSRRRHRARRWLRAWKRSARMPRCARCGRPGR